MSIYVRIVGMGKNFLRSTGVALMVSGALGLAVLPLTADMAEAKGKKKAGSRSSQSSSGGRGSSRSSRAERATVARQPAVRTNVVRQPAAQVQTVSTGNPNPGLGPLASELKGLNAAHASQNGLENASPNSMTGKLYIYQQATTSIVDAKSAVKSATVELVRLNGLTLTEVGKEFALTDAEIADGLTVEQKYTNAIAAAVIVIDAAGEVLESTESDAEDALEMLTDGGILSAEAMVELHDLLGLEPPVS